MKITLPAILQPISRRKDKSVCLKFDTREMSPEETMMLLSLENSEGYLVYAPNSGDIDLKEIPKDRAEVGSKTPSELLRSVIFVHYKQATKDGKYVGLFDTFYKEQMEKIREGYKIKNLHE